MTELQPPANAEDLAIRFAAQSEGHRIWVSIDGIAETPASHEEMPITLHVRRVDLAEPDAQAPDPDITLTLALEGSSEDEESWIAIPREGSQWSAAIFDADGVIHQIQVLFRGMRLLIEDLDAMAVHKTFTVIEFDDGL